LLLRPPEYLVIFSERFLIGILLGIILGIIMVAGANSCNGKPF